MRNLLVMSESLLHEKPRKVAKGTKVEIEKRCEICDRLFITKYKHTKICKRKECHSKYQANQKKKVDIGSHYCHSCLSYHKNENMIAHKGRMICKTCYSRIKKGKVAS
mgnify:CR=1 FL=1